MPIGCITSALLRSSSLKLLPPAAIVRQASSTCSSLSANERLWRSFLYVPGDQEKKVSKIANLCDTHRISPDIPDVVVLDFEDGVSSENKECARKLIASAFQRRCFQDYRSVLKRNVCVRINPPSTGLAGDDLHVLLSACVETMKAHGGQWPGPDYIALPKTESIRELRWVESQVIKIFQKHSVSHIPPIALIGLIESPQSLMNMRDLCKSAGENLSLPLIALVFGSDDYCASLGVTHTEGRQETMFARQYMVTMCRAYGLAAIDMVETDINDMAKFQESCILGAKLGYFGKQLIHPKHIESANLEFSPSPELIEWATAVVEAAAAQTGGGLASSSSSSSSSSSINNVVEKAALEAGAFAFRGHMIDKPSIRQARRVVQVSRLMRGN